MRSSKKRYLSVVILLLLTLVFVFALTACGGGGGPTQTGDRITIKYLEDLKDYGFEAYYTNPKATYSSTDKSEQIAKLVKKQDEERRLANNRMAESLPGNAGYEKIEKVDWETENDWDNDIYHRFAIPYYNSDGDANVWEKDNNDSTITKVFCYADMEELLERIAEAAVPTTEMKKLVAYITREDDAWEDKAKHTKAKYTLKRGDGSAIKDFNDIDEIDELLSDWEGDKVNGLSEDDWKDIQALKRRKINAELFYIFEDKPDMYARFSIHMTAYEYQVLEEVIMPLFYDSIGVAEERILSHVRDSKLVLDPANFSDKWTFTGAFSNVKLDNIKNDSFSPFIYFMKEAMIDYEHAVYLSAFKQFGNMKANANGKYKATEMAKLMTLQAYNYQYQKNDYEAWKDDAEYEEYLALSRKEYFGKSDGSAADSNEAKRYRDLDSKHYEKAYRYRHQFYDLYYKVEMDFQQLQEALDMIVFSYPELINDETKGILHGENIDFFITFGKGIGYTGGESYVDQMRTGLDNHAGTKYNLLMADGNHLYMSDDIRLSTYNKYHYDYNVLSESAKEKADGKLKKVLFECEQLTIQHYLLGLDQLKADEYKAFKEFLAFQQYVYHSDWIKEQQSYKKDIVLKQAELVRTMNLMDEQMLDGSEIWNTEIRDQEEEIGRKTAFYDQIDANGNKNLPNATNSRGVNFGQIAKDIPTINKKSDYVDYNKRDNKPEPIDEYFKNRVIQKDYPTDYLDGTKEWGPGGIGYDKEGIYVEKVYNTNWEISRMLSTHEYVFRHLIGQSEVSLQKINVSQSQGGKEHFEWYFKEVKNYELISEGEVFSYDVITSYKVSNPKKIIPYGKSNESEIMFDRDKPIIEEVKGSGPDDWLEKPTYSTETVGDPFEWLYARSVSDQVTYYTFGIRFIAWCIDSECRFELKDGEKFGFNMSLYPKYELTVAEGNVVEN